MRLKELSRGCFDVPARLSGIDVKGIACDSRHVQPGFLFVAVPGESTDGHLYAARAVEQGAVAIVGERARRRGRAMGHGLESLKVPYIGVTDSRSVLGRLAANLHSTTIDRIEISGVTGTKGKTTTTWVLDAILRAAGKLTALVGTVENRVGSKVYPSGNTTPGCLEIHGYLDELAAIGGTHAVLEVSSHGIQQRRVAGLSFRCGIFTNVAPEHLDYHKTFESYVETKVRFFEELGPGAFVVLPSEEQASQTIAARTGATVAWYGEGSHDGVERLRMTAEGLAFSWKGLRVRTQLWGHHNLLNILGAMTAAECLGLERSDIVLGVEQVRAPPGRLERIDHDGPFNVFVDYAHTDGALDTVLGALRALTPGRLITIFGCGGDRDRLKRPRMGRVAEKWSDHVVVTSDNPRTEDPRRIIEEISKGFERPEEAVFETDRREAIALGLRMARAGDTVLIAGKGHETYQEIAGKKSHFDDREVAREILKERAAP